MYCIPPGRLCWLAALAFVAVPDVSAWPCSIAGRWNSTLGPATVAEVVSSGRTTISGVFDAPQGAMAFNGALNGSRFEIVWSRPLELGGQGQTGSGAFAASADCSRLDGQISRNDPALQDQVWSADRSADDSIGGISLSKVIGAARQLDIAASILGDDAKLLPAASFDAAAIVKAVGSDPATLTQWVAEHTSMLPYSGALRGAAGVWMDRQGNSLDRARLLAALLAAAGSEIRFVHGKLDRPVAESLAASIGSSGPPVQDTQPLSQDTPEAILARQPGLDRDRFDRLAAELDAAAKTLRELMNARVEDQSAALMKMLGAIPSEPAPDIAEILSDHWWVQVKSAGVWVDCDPSVLAARPNVAEAFAPDQLPARLHHVVTFRVILELWENGKRREAPLLSERVQSDEALGTDIAFYHLPLTTKAPATFAELIDNPASYADRLAKEWRWAPVMRVGDRTAIGQEFDLKGNVKAVDPAELSPGGGAAPAAASASVFGGFDKVLGALDSADAQSGPPADEATAPVRVTAEFLEVTIEQPGSPSTTHRRTIFDLLGPAARAQEKEPRIGPEQQRERALALQGMARLEIFAAEPPSPVVMRIAAERYGKLFREAAAAFRSFVLGRPLEPFYLGEDADDLLNSVLMTARQGRGDEVAIHLTSPNIVSFWTAPRGGASGATTTTASFDIIENRTAILPLSNGSRFASALTQGVRDTAAEQFILNGAEPSANASALFAIDLAAGRNWLLLRPGDNAALKALALDPDAKARIAESLRAGFMAAAPPAPSLIDGAERVGWWRIDPRTGATLGIMDSGAGQATEEKAELEQQVAFSAIRVFLIGRCFYRGMTGSDMAASIFCAAGHIIAMGGQLQKIANILKWASFPASEYEGWDLGGTAMGLGGELLGDIADSQSSRR